MEKKSWRFWQGIGWILIFFLSFIYKRINKFIVVRFCALLLAIVYEHKRVILKGENPDYQQC